MSVRDRTTTVEPRQSLAPATIGSDTNTDGNAVDRQGFEAATAIMEVSSFTDGNYQLVLQHDDDDGAGSPAGSWADVPAAELINGQPSLGAAGIAKAGYIGTKRHLRVRVTSTGTTTGATVGGIIVLGSPRYAGEGPQKGIL